MSVGDVRRVEDLRAALLRSAWFRDDFLFQPEVKMLPPSLASSSETKDINAALTLVFQQLGQHRIAIGHKLLVGLRKRHNYIFERGQRTIDRYSFALLRRTEIAGKRF